MTRLPPGTTSFPFQLQIPLSPELPSSFKSSIGIIIYQVLAIVNIGPQNLKKGEKTLTFRGAVEINRANEPPIEFEKSDNNTRYTFRTSSSGFVIGREIPFEIRVDSPS